MTNIDGDYCIACKREIKDLDTNLDPVEDWFHSLVCVECQEELDDK